MSDFSYYFFNKYFGLYEQTGYIKYILCFSYQFSQFLILILNLCDRDFDVNKNHFNYKAFTREILDINRVRCNYGEMAEITYPHFDQRYSKYISRNSMGHNLQRTEENGDNNFIGLILNISSIFMQIILQSKTKSCYHH